MTLVRAAVRERAVGVGRSRFARARDDEEITRAAAVLPFFFEKFFRAVVEIVFSFVEQNDGAAIFERREERVKIVVADRRERFHVGGLAAATRFASDETARIEKRACKTPLNAGVQYATSLLSATATFCSAAA